MAVKLQLTSAIKTAVWGGTANGKMKCLLTAGIWNIMVVDSWAFSNSNISDTCLSTGLRVITLKGRRDDTIYKNIAHAVIRSRELLGQANSP